MEKKSLTVSTSSLDRLRDFALFLACILFLDFQLRVKIGTDAVLVTKCAYLLETLSRGLTQGLWIVHLPFLLPLALAAWSGFALAINDRHRIDAEARKISVLRTFFFIPIQKREVLFESLAALQVTERSQNLGYTLWIEEASGRRTAIHYADRSEKLFALARKIQEIINVPVRGEQN